MKKQNHSFDQLTSWFRNWVEGRDATGAKQVFLTAIEKNYSYEKLSQLLIEADTDRVYANEGHTLPFANKAIELTQFAGDEHRKDLLPLPVRTVATSRGMEEQKEWHHPVEIIEPLREAEQKLPTLLEQNRIENGNEEEKLLPVLLGDDPLEIIDQLAEAIQRGAPLPNLSRRIAHAAALRLAQFSPSNDVNDWFNPQHTFIYTNDLHQALKRTPTPLVARGLFHGAINVYMDRFLNVHFRGRCPTTRGSLPHPAVSTPDRHHCSPPAPG